MQYDVDSDTTHRTPTNERDGPNKAELRAIRSLLGPCFK